MPHIAESCAPSSSTAAADDSSDGFVQPTVRALAAGIPNTGKSTLINVLRSLGHGGAARKAVRVGRLAGQTRRVSPHPVVLTPGSPGSFQSNNECRLVMLDTPGILEPVARSLAEQLSLSVCGAVNLSQMDQGACSRHCSLRVMVGVGV